MESSDLCSASTYVNNLLLARGLLRDGKTIDFARLAQPSNDRKKKVQRHLRFEDNQDVDKEKLGDRYTNKDGETVQIATQVLNLIHDLILRRDRDQTHQEQTAQAMLSLQSEATSSTNTTRRLETANADLVRQLANQETATRAAEAAARSAEASARALREETARAKTLLAHVRTHCANDVRKRDVELARLKAHLSGQQRGSYSGNRTSAAVVAPSCTIVRGSTMSTSSVKSAKEDDAHLLLSVQDADYSLRQETNEFLTQLSQSLSDENDALLGLIQTTLSTLRELQGLSDHTNDRQTPSMSIGTSQQKAHSLHGNDESRLVNAPPTSYVALAADLEPVLASLRELLSTPSFVSIEEVQVRDDEITRLREGWERMEARWREAAQMMHGWRQRMLGGGDTVNLDEVKAGLKLGEGLEGYIADSSEADVGRMSDWRRHEEESEDDFSEVVEESLVEPAVDTAHAADESLLDDSQPLPDHPASTPVISESLSATSESQPASSAASRYSHPRSSADREQGTLLQPITTPLGEITGNVDMSSPVPYKATKPPTLSSMPVLRPKKSGTFSSGGLQQQENESISPTKRPFVDKSASLTDEQGSGSEDELGQAQTVKLDFALGDLLHTNMNRS